MDFKELQELLKLINRLELGEFRYKKGDLELSVRSKFYSRPKSGEVVAPYVATTPQSAAPAYIPPAPQESKPAQEAEQESAAPAPADVKGGLVEIRSPIVGTFYRSPSPDKAPFVKPGDSISVGTVVCIVEAMKLFNEIESEVAGKVVKVVVEDASPVEYDQLLFLIDPNA
jgi:acetyl-CoA carboxylase biotin carboxyl carrier protein